jgi:hypothetical protein
LVQLVVPLQRAIERRGVVVVLGLWHRMRYVDLLPFHVHLRWPGVVDGLPLNATIAVAPLLDTELVNTPLYGVAAAREARRAARWARSQDGTARGDPAARGFARLWAG